MALLSIARPLADLLVVFLLFLFHGSGLGMVSLQFSSSASLRLTSWWSSLLILVPWFRFGNGQFAVLILCLTKADLLVVFLLFLFHGSGLGMVSLQFSSSVSPWLTSWWFSLLILVPWFRFGNGQFAVLILCLTLADLLVVFFTYSCSMVQVWEWSVCSSHPLPHPG